MGSNSTPIPSIDLTKDPETLEQGSQQWNSATQIIRKAFESNGCLLVKYDKVSQNDRRNLFEAMRSLFDLPIETKMKNTDRPSLTTYPGTIPNVPLYEAQGVMNAVDLEKVEGFTKLMWPQGNEKFCETIHSMSNKMLEILEIILSMVVDSYDVSIDNTFIGGTDALFHMIKYKAPEKEEPALGLSPHTDINYLTILCQNEVEGLSIKTQDGDWVPVNPGSAHFVVFAGQSLRAWSNGRLHTPLHKVVFSGLKDRLSCAVFLKPKPDQIVDAVPQFIDSEHPRKYKPYAYGEFHEYSKVTHVDHEHILETYASI